MPSPVPSAPTRSPLAYATAPVRLVGDLVLGLAYTAHELPLLVQDARTLVNDLARLAHSAEDGALTDLVAELARAAAPGGELSRLLDGAAQLAAARAARERAELGELAAGQGV